METLSQFYSMYNQVAEVKAKNEKLTEKLEELDSELLIYHQVVDKLSKDI